MRRFELWLFYDASPLIAYDGERAPACTMHRYTPSSVPGSRVPHLWLGHGRSLYDLMGGDYALLRFDPQVDVSPLLAAAAAVGMPLRVVDAPSAELPAPYRHKLALSRPDQHIAWRGDTIPSDARGLIDLVRGARP